MISNIDSSIRDLFVPTILLKENKENTTEELIDEANLNTTEYQRIINQIEVLLSKLENKVTLDEFIYYFFNLNDEPITIFSEEEINHIDNNLIELIDRDIVSRYVSFVFIRNFIDNTGTYPDCSEKLLHAYNSQEPLNINDYYLFASYLATLLDMVNKDSIERTSFFLAKVDRLNPKPVALNNIDDFI